MERFFWLIVLLTSAGCAVSTVTSTPEQATPMTAARMTNHIFPSNDSIEKLLLGISREEALALVGRTTTIGYELRQGSNDEYQAVTVQNPHKSQQITRGSDIFQVDYYLVKITKADGIVTDDEIMPLVFESNRLIGKGWDFLNSKIRK